MMSKQKAEHFAKEWIAAWNSHDLERILSHYTGDFEMSSPKIVQIAGEPSGTLKGRNAVSAYWKRALEQMPNLHFKLNKVLFGVDTICIYYESKPGLDAVEWFLLNNAGKVTKASAHYSHLEGVRQETSIA